jgi:hypothetical protein
MGDVEMSDAGGVSVQLPTDPVQRNTFFMPPVTSAKAEADLYSKLKRLQRNLEFLTLQEVSGTITCVTNCRNTLKTNNEVYEENSSEHKKKSNEFNLYLS